MSSYVKALEAVMRMFPKKIKVILSDAESGERIGECKMTLDELPEKFNKPTLLTALGRQWRVLEAKPRKAIEFEFSKNLSLKVIDPSLPNRNNRYYHPSQAGEFPECAEAGLFNQFTIEKRVEDWRQIEFLHASFSDVIQQELSDIDLVLHPEKSSNLLLGYERVHIREKILMSGCNIPFAEFCNHVNVIEKGSARFLMNSGSYIKDGFALRSPNYEYYGICENGIIKSLCLTEFDCPDEELLNVLSSFGLVLVVWCEAKMFTGEMKDGGGDEVPSLGTDQVSDGAMM